MPVCRKRLRGLCRQMMTAEQLEQDLLCWRKTRACRVTCSATVPLQSQQLEIKPLKTIWLSLSNNISREVLTCVAALIIQEAEGIDFGRPQGNIVFRQKWD